MTSNYYKDLDVLSRIRYEIKLNVDGFELPDPLDKMLLETIFAANDTTNWPDISFGYIYMYLVETHCWYTKEQFQSYKLLDGYNLFCTGKIQKTYTYCAPVCVIITGDIEAGQTLGKFYQAWVITDKNGKILSAHCTCMAGLGEACSHIAALLFAVETTTKLELHKPTSTSVPCKWKAVARKVMPSKVVDIDFRKPSLKERDGKQSDPIKRKAISLNLSSSFKENLVKTIVNSTETSHLQSMFSDSEDTDSADESTSQTAFNANLLSLTTKSLYKNVERERVLACSISSEQAAAIEQKTRLQAECPIWKEQRKGRITASYFGRVYKVKTGMNNLASDVMGNSKTPEGLPSLLWGKKKEPEAISAFEKLESSKHKDFRVTRSGLWVLPEQPFLGASPDGLVSCGCCNDAVLEVKCPYSIKSEKISASCGQKTFHLNESRDLKKDHRYFFQSQGLMAVTGRKKCYFVTYTTKDLHVTEVLFDVIFWGSLKLKLESFFLNYVFPKLNDA